MLHNAGVQPFGTSWDFWDRKWPGLKSTSPNSFSIWKEMRSFRIAFLIVTLRYRQSGRLAASGSVSSVGQGQCLRR